jgi:hypothetical protein
MRDLFRTGELLVAGDLAHGFAEAAGGECGQGYGIEVLGLGLCAQLKANRGVRTGLANSSPKCKKFFGGYENARLI